jgi:hypothetical protein
MQQIGPPLQNAGNAGSRSSSTSKTHIAKEETMKTRHFIAAISMVAITVLSCQAASAYDRGVTVTTPKGTYTKSVNAACSGGVCSRDAEVTGPKGGTVSRSGSCAAGWRFYGCTSTATGPKGNSVTRHTVGRR